MKKILILLSILLLPVPAVLSQSSSGDYYSGTEAGNNTAQGFQQRVIVDNFDRQNPLTIYRALEDDDSQLEIMASPIAHSGLNSMKLEYGLFPSGLHTTKVKIVWYNDEGALNWETGKELRLWIKGDGTGNVFKLALIDIDGEKWIFENSEVLKRSEWQLLKMPLTEFKLKEGSGNKLLDLTSIKGIEYIIEGKDSNDYTGEIYLDDLSLEGDQLDSSIAVLPDIAAVLPAFAVGLMNIRFNLIGVTLARQTPEQGTFMTSWLHTDIVGTLRNAVIESRITMADVNYGQGAVNGPYPEREHYKKNYQLKGGYIKFSFLNLTSFISKVSIGNLRIDYSRFTYSPYHTTEEDTQYKGVSVEGGLKYFDYHSFFIKHWHDAGTFGSSLIANYEGFTFRTIYVGVVNKARKGDYTEANGEVQWTTDFASKTVDKDNVVTGKLTKSFFRDVINIDIEAGYNEYKSYADYYIPDPNNPEPKWNYDYTNAKTYKGKMFYPGIRFIPLEGTVLEAKYLNFDEDFKPMYRDAPTYFDDEWSDLTGMEVNVIQFFNVFVFSINRKDVTRKSDNEFFYDYWRANIEYNYKTLRIAYSHQWRNDKYKYISYKSDLNTDKDSKSEQDEVRTIFRISGEAEASAGFIQENQHQNVTEENVVRTELSMAFWYFLTQTTKLEIKGKEMKHGAITGERPDDLNDNYVELLLEVKF